MPLRALVPLGLGLVGVAKAAALVLVGPSLGLSALLVSVAAALWITAPPTAAWLFARWRAGRSAQPA